MVSLSARGVKFVTQQGACDDFSFSWKVLCQLRCAGDGRMSCRPGGLWLSVPAHHALSTSTSCFMKEASLWFVQCLFTQYAEILDNLELMYSDWLVTCCSVALIPFPQVWPQASGLPSGVRALSRGLCRHKLNTG